MSLVRIALRMAVVEALKGRTLVGDNVLDSRIGVIEVGKDGGTQTNQTKPFIAVYTGAGKTDVRDLRSLIGNGETWLILELGVTAKMSAVDPLTDESVLLANIPVTDDAMELLLDLAVREISLALTEDDNPWADIYRGLTNRVLGIEVEPFRSDEGQRLAARQVRIKLDLIDDPVFGEAAPADTVLGPFLALLDGVPGKVAASTADLLRTAIGPGGLADWEIHQRRLGATRDELLALGLGPIEPDVDRTTPVLTEIEGVPEPVVVFAP